MTLRTRVTLACLVIGAVLVGLNFVNVPATSGLRPYVLYVGIALLVLSLVLVLTRPRVESPAESAADQASPIAVLEPVAPPAAPPRAHVALAVASNGATDPSVRWYHVAAATGTDVAAKKAQVSVTVRGGEVRPERWQWQTGDRVDVSAGGARIPIVIGRVTESALPVVSGWTVPFKNWYLTPSANASLGPFLAPFIAGFRHLFDVTVRWNEGREEQTASGSFELRFWREPTSEPRFMRVGERPTYRDQVGGLAELHERGTALRKEGMLLPFPALHTWLGRVDSWTSETKALIAEVSTADSDYFFALRSFEAPRFEGIRMHDEKHRRTLQELNERLVRLQHFIRPGAS